MLAAYDISATSEIEGRVSLWRNESTVHTESYLRDAAGNTIWNGPITDGTNHFTVSNSAFAPSHRDENHRQLGLTWKTRHPKGWNTSVVVTSYKILHDADHVASNPPPVADLGGAGTITKRDGTGWNTFEVQANYKPVAGDFGDGRHALTFGLHRNQYKLDNTVYKNTTDWNADDGSTDQYYRGKTSITALYGQDAWRIDPDLTLTAGMRVERFRSTDGVTFFSGVAPADYDARQITATSPKLSLAWRATGDMRFKFSAGKGVRFPNLDELFNGSKTSTSIQQSDPNLKAERSNAIELSAEKDYDTHQVRLSYFRDDSRDTILRQSDTTVSPTVTRVSNVDRVLTDGLELSWNASDVVLPGLDLTGNATWADSVIKENSRNPATVGKKWVRIPKQRYSMQASYRISHEWLVAAAYRWHGRMHNTDTNIDINPETYGGTSHVKKLDLRANWKFQKEWELGFGIDNVTNFQAYQAHSLPQRSYHTSLSYSLK